MRIDEVAATVGTELAVALHSAVETISSSQRVTFTLYVKQILPLDGYVYWVKASIVNPAELARLGLSDSPLSVSISGSLHRQALSEQTDTVSQSINHIIFTPIEKIDDFNVVDPNGMYLGQYEGVQFTFSRMDSRYTQAGIFHYRGESVRPSMRTQIIDSQDDINTDLVLSNSIPIWLLNNHIAPVYPSYLLPANVPAPYIVADVQSTKPLQGAAGYVRNPTTRIILDGFSTCRIR
ncbi:hypothetical protein [Budvicia aquatica]|uniref:Uncharacterized protein n=1 Tax=Budvicia aquatica TaxID=82979 RepID=A0A484ZU74_9GAMM|nr:hypothetical protein [Budvicia aquatica]VFS51418.1 Uncharacterised protein [Budvicia aquatica]